MCTKSLPAHLFYHALLLLIPVGTANAGLKSLPPLDSLLFTPPARAEQGGVVAPIEVQSVFKPVLVIKCAVKSDSEESVQTP